MYSKALLEQKLFNDEIVRESVRSEDVDQVAKILEDFLDSETIDESVCYNFYKKMNLPYPVVYRAFGLIESAITDEETKKKLNKLLNLTAKVYIKKDISSLKKKIVNKPLHEFMLFQAHEGWIEQIVNAVKNDEIEKYPIVDSQKCTFKKYLAYLESLMICFNANVCVYIMDLHSLIHTLANSFYSYYKKGYYAESYFVFKDLKEQILKFYNMLNELHIATYANPEKSLFDLIEMLVRTKTLYVAVIDLKNMKSLNSLLNETTVTTAKAELFTKLYEKYYDKKNFLIIQAVSNDFYFVGMDISSDEFEKEVEKIKKVIQEPINVGSESVEFDALVLGVKLDKYSQIDTKELINYFRFLKKHAKKTKKALGPDTKEELNKWLKNRIDVKFVKEKLKNREVDVVFQPVFKSEDSKVFSLEVLGRIVDKERLIPAGMFIDNIYEMNKIAEFDMIVLDKLLEKERLIKQISTKLFLNISFEALKNKEYIEKLNTVIGRMDVDIILELTEQRFVENLDIIEKINKNTDTFFAVDDFGSGYSSILLVINLLKKRLIRVLKIDGSLIQGIKNDEYLQKAIKIIAGFKKEFDLHLVAEFVEDEETLEFLKQSGVDLVQGYYLSMPKTIEELLIQKQDKLKNIFN